MTLVELTNQLKFAKLTYNVVSLALIKMCVHVYVHVVYTCSIVVDITELEAQWTVIISKNSTPLHERLNSVYKLTMNVRNHSLTSCSVQGCTLSSFSKLGNCLETLSEQAMELMCTQVFHAVHNIIDQVISCAIVSYIVIATASTKGLWLGKQLLLTSSVRKGFNAQLVTEYVTYRFQLHREMYKYKLPLNWGHLH